MSTYQGDFGYSYGAKRLKRIFGQPRSALVGHVPPITRELPQAKKASQTEKSSLSKFSITDELSESLTFTSSELPSSSQFEWFNQNFLDELLRTKFCVPEHHVSELSVDTQKTKERLTTTITVASDHDSDSEESGKFAVAEEDSPSMVKIPPVKSYIKEWCGRLLKKGPIDTEFSINYLLQTPSSKYPQGQRSNIDRMELPIIKDLMAKLCAYIEKQKHDLGKDDKSGLSPINDDLALYQLSLELKGNKCCEVDQVDYVIQTIMTHVFICGWYKKGSEIETGKIVSTFFLIRWRGYDNSEMSWEPFNSLSLDLFSKILDYFNGYVAAFGPQYYGPPKPGRTRPRLSPMSFFASAAGARVLRSRKECVSMLFEDQIVSPTSYKIFQDLKRLSFYDDNYGFANSYYGGFSATAEERMLLTWDTFRQRMANVTSSHVYFERTIFGSIGTRLSTAQDKLLGENPELTKVLGQATNLYKAFRDFKQLKKIDDSLISVSAFFQSNLAGFSNSYHLLVLIYDGSIRVYDSYSQKVDFSKCTFLNKLKEKANLKTSKSLFLYGTQKEDMSCFRRALSFIEHVVTGHPYQQFPWDDNLKA